MGDDGFDDLDNFGFFLTDEDLADPDDAAVANPLVGRGGGAGVPAAGPQGRTWRPPRRGSRRATGPGPGHRRATRPAPDPERPSLLCLMTTETERPKSGA